MSLKSHQIETLIIKENSKSCLAETLLAYFSLKHELKNIENQSWYFKQAIASKQQKLYALADRFEKIRILFNSSDIDYFIHKINDNNDYLTTSESNYRGFNHRVICSWKRNENELFNEFIQLKNKTEFIMPLEDYFEHPEEFLKIIN